MPRPISASPAKAAPHHEVVERIVAAIDRHLQEKIVKNLTVEAGDERYDVLVGPSRIAAAA
jgi:hypothetical protein